MTWQARQRHGDKNKTAHNETWSEIMQHLKEQAANATTYAINLNGGETYLYLLAMGGGGGGSLDQVASDVYYPGPINFNDTLNWDGSNWVPGFNYNYSDSTLKTNITPITGALDKIRNLRGVRFEWTDPKYRGSTIGMIAQEIEVEFPEVVHTGTDDKKQVDYGSMVGALVEAIKEQQEQISALSARITELGG